MLSQDFIQQMKQRLEEEKARLQGELKAIPEHTEMGDEEDDQSDELQVDEVNRDIIARLRADLLKIDKALGKIASGTYGIDDEGKEISEERLRALPWADKAL